MNYFMGMALGLVAVLLAAATGFDRQRVFYPTLLIVIATYYILFAVMDGSPLVILLESLPAVLFLGIAVSGFKFNLWYVVAGLAGHAVFDAGHHLIIDNAGVPGWWPGFCLTIDLTMAAFLAFLLLRKTPVIFARSPCFSVKGRANI